MGRITRTGTAAAVAAALAVGLAATPVTAADEESFVVVKAGRVITVSGEEISRGEIVIIDGKIRLVGVGLDYPADATVIDARDQTVMPGWVHPSSRHGLLGYSRNGVAGNESVNDEVMLESIDFDPFLMAGYTAVGLRPDGGGIPGTMSVYRTGGPDDLDPLLGESRMLRELSALRIGMTSPARDKNIIRGAIGKAKAELEKIAKAREEFEKKQAEEKKKAEEAAKKNEGGDGEGEKKEEAEFTPPATDATHQPLMDWLEEELAVRPLVELGGASTLLHFEEVMASHEKLRSNLYLAASSSTSEIVDRLAERDAIVVTTMSMTTLPQTSTVFNLAGALDAAGASLALTPESIGGGGGFRGRGRGGRGGGAAPAAQAADATASLRSARSRLGSLVRAGLSRETAIKAVTLHPAMVLGVDNRIGSIEAGKDADLIFLSGDPVDPVATVERVMILGRIVWETGQ